MKEQTQKYLEYANEAVTKIREINQLMGGSTAIPQEKSLLGNVYYYIVDMIQIHLDTVGMRVMNDDDFNDMIVQIMFAEKSEIGSIVKKYCDSSV